MVFIFILWSITTLLSWRMESICCLIATSRFLLFLGKDFECSCRSWGTCSNFFYSSLPSRISSSRLDQIRYSFFHNRWPLTANSADIFQINLVRTSWCLPKGHIWTYYSSSYPYLFSYGLEQNTSQNERSWWEWQVHWCWILKIRHYDSRYR